MMEPIKSGAKTTEFYLTLLAQFLGVGVTLALLTNAQAQEIVGSTGNLVEAVAAWLTAMAPLLAAFGVLVKYISARTRLKETFEKVKAGFEDLFGGESKARR